MLYVNDNLVSKSICRKCHKPIAHEGTHQLCKVCFRVYTRYVNIFGKIDGNRYFNKYNPPKQRIGALITI